MAKPRSLYVCSACGTTAPQWQGQCPGCDAWNTLEIAPALGVVASSRPRALTGVSADLKAVMNPEAEARISTGMGELDRVLGGGLVAGSVTLLGGDPGIGKSTLLLQALGHRAARGGRSLLVCAEESKQQVRLRAERLGVLEPELWVVAETSLPAITA